jgi:hypothetical protein
MASCDDQLEGTSNTSLNANAVLASPLLEKRGHSLPSQYQLIITRGHKLQL